MSESAQKNISITLIIAIIGLIITGGGIVLSRGKTDGIIDTRLAFYQKNFDKVMTQIEKMQRSIATIEANQAYVKSDVAELKIKIMQLMVAK